MLGNFAADEDIMLFKILPWGKRFIKLVIFGVGVALQPPILLSINLNCVFLETSRL